MRFALLLALFSAAMPAAPRVVLDAHNCYPYDGKYQDRIEVALKTGLPLAIEQDLAWYVDPATGQGRSVLIHGDRPNGSEPNMRDYFFERIRPIVEQALKENRRDRWPLITLNLDFKSDEPAHHQAVLKLLTEYQPWLTTAPRTATPAVKAPLDWKPVLVLTGVSNAQQKSFHDDIAVGGRLLLFGAGVVTTRVADTPVDQLIPAPSTNYRRWLNAPWSIVEQGGQTKAGDWSKADAARLAAILARARQFGYAMRLYTLNGHEPAVGTAAGWSAGYNFGSRAAVELRWKAAVKAGVDYIATDQYEEFAPFVKRSKRGRIGIQ
ncbi:MAG: hypothetical protein K2X03_13815 [Bryobacteraceae bacterium]|nr:hypothetical protein [Bryobacteraceae bacterium]